MFIYFSYIGPIVSIIYAVPVSTPASTYKRARVQIQQLRDFYIARGLLVHLY